MKFSQKSIRIAALFAAILIGINFAASSALWLAYAGKVGENLLDSNAEATILRLGEGRFPVLRLTSIHDELLRSESVWIYQNGELMCVSDVLIEFATGCTTEAVTTPLYYAVHSYGNGSNYGAPNAYGGWEEWFFYSVVNDTWSEVFHFYQYHESDVPQDAWDQFFVSDAYSSGCEWAYNEASVYFNRPSLHFILSKFSENGEPLRITTSEEYSAALNSLVSGHK